MSVSEVINTNAVALNLEAANKTEVLDRLAELLWKDGSIGSKEAFVADVLLRESEGKTGIGGGVAIPHGKSDAVKKTCIAIAKLKEPIEWETIDGKPVRMVLLFAVDGKDKNNYFVKLMSRVARLLAREDFCRKLLSVEDKEELLKLFQNEERE